jgi:putative ABC transport system permease protein
LEDRLVLKNYLLSAYRNLLRSKLDTFLNISGLVIGLSAALLISLFVRYESSYDEFWSDSDRLHRIQTRWVLEGRDDIDVVNTTGRLKALLENYYANELEAVARLQAHKPVLSTATESFSESVTFADPEILEIFDFEIVAGDAVAALSDNASIVLNETLAAKIFGTLDPIGQTLTLANQYLKRDYRVGAVMRDLPLNSHLDVQSMIRIDESDYADNDGAWMFSLWDAANNHTYFKLRDDIPIDEIDGRIPDFTDASIPDDDNEASRYYKLTTIAVQDIHLRSAGAGSMKPDGDSDIVAAFLVIALLIVIVATINYVNLATARAGQRAREVAMRKVVGASRGQLIAQHLGESLLMVALALVLTIVVVELALPWFNQMLNLHLALNITDPTLSGGLFLGLIVIGTLSGLYPALVLSSWRPSNCVRANQSTEMRGTTRTRNCLVIFQTAVTVTLIVATIVVYAQLTFFRSLDRGFDSDNLLVVNGMARPVVAGKQDAFREQVATLAGIADVSLSYEAPTYFYENNMRATLPGDSPDKSYPLGETNVDYGYIETLRIPLLAGRFFRRDHSLDRWPSGAEARDGDVLQGNILVNEKAVRALGLGSPQQAIGSQLQTRFRLQEGEGKGGVVLARLTIIGVLDNANLHSAKIPVRPEVYELNDYYNHLLIRYSGSAQDALNRVGSVWEKLLPGAPFEYYFVDQALAEEFQSEANQANIFLGFALLTMVVGCLGLYGLAAFVTECRRREIGIRKILGAGVRDILALVLNQFSRLALIAIVIAWPVAYALMSDWLQQYPFRVENGWVAISCVVAGLLASVVVTITVGMQALGVARLNPINAIRSE